MNTSIALHSAPWRPSLVVLKSSSYHAAAVCSSADGRFLDTREEAAGRLIAFHWNDPKSAGYRGKKGTEYLSHMEQLKLLSMQTFNLIFVECPADGNVPAHKSGHCDSKGDAWRYKRFSVFPACESSVRNVSLCSRSTQTHEVCLTSENEATCELASVTHSEFSRHQAFPPLNRHSHCSHSARTHRSRREGSYHLFSSLISHCEMKSTSRRMLR